MRKHGLVAIWILLAAICSTDPVAAQPAAEDPAAAGEAAPEVPGAGEEDAARAAGAGEEDAARATGEEEPARAAPPVIRPAPARIRPAPIFLGPPSEQEAETVEGTPRSEAVALGLSLGGTAMSWLLMVAGARSDGDLSAAGLLGSFLAPSFGHWYRGAVLTRGMGVRALGMVASAVGILNVVRCEGCDRNTTLLLLYGGLALYVGGTIDDIVMAPLRVRWDNRRLRPVQLAPMVAPHTAGLSLGGRF